MITLSSRAPVRRPESPEQVVASAPELEALPIVAQRVLGKVRDDGSSFDEIARMLGTDQALTAAVLRSANSAAAMPNRRIASLRESIARIGQRTLAEVLVRACASPMLDRGLPPYALPRRIAWRHAATASVAARRLARLLSLDLAEEATVAGLLHDVGKTVLTSVCPEAAAEAVSIARSRRLPVWQAEEQVLGFSHGAVGGALLRSWGLPEQIAEAVAWHHQPERSANPLATIVYLSDAAAHQVGAVGSGGACPQPDWDMAAAERLGAHADEIWPFLEQLQCVEEDEL